MALFSARIKELEGQLAAAIEARDLLQANVDELTQANTDFNTRHEADKAELAKLEGLTKERDQFKADLETAKASLKSEQDSSEQAINAEVIKRCTAAGVDPVRRDPGATQASVVSWAEFSAMNSAEKETFFKNGGKIAAS